MDDDAFEQSRDGGVIGEHEAGDAVGGVFEVRGFLGEGDLDGGRAPGDESCELSFADAEERFVDLS